VGLLPLVWLQEPQRRSLKHILRQFFQSQFQFLAPKVKALTKL
jgi:hypothetical protein